MSKTLRIIGVLALVAWTVLGLIGWSRVGDGVHVTLMEGDQPPSPDAALLADRFDVLDGDVDALVAAIGENFELLAGAMESGGASTATKLARAEERLAALEAALPRALEARETAATLAASLGRAEALADELKHAVLLATPVARADGGGLETPIEPTIEPAVDAPGGDVAVTDLPIAVEQPTVEPTMDAAIGAPGASPESVEPVSVVAPADPAVDVAVAAPVGSEAAPAKSFLSFKLPSRDFSFEGRQTFEVLTDLSRVGFDAKSTLHDFTGASSDVVGDFTVDLSRASDGIDGEITVSSASLDTGLEGRDDAMWEHLETKKFETLAFVPTAFETTEVDVSRSTLSGKIAGKMTIHGTTRDVSMEVSASVDDARRLVVEGEMPLKLDDYGVEIPSKLGLISVEKEVRVWIRLRLRARKGGGKS